MITPTENYESGRKGAAGEMLVIADLLHRGYEVWRAVSGQAACDLVAEIGEKLYKIEVRSVARQVDGTPNSPGGRTMLSRKGHHILAVVDRTTGTIRYYTDDGDLHIDLFDLRSFPTLSLLQRMDLAIAHLQALPLPPVESMTKEEISAAIPAITGLMAAIEGVITEAAPLVDAR